MNESANTSKSMIAIVLLIGINLFFSSQIMSQRLWHRQRAPVTFEEFTTLNSETGLRLVIEFEAGKSHNHPLMVFWIEDTTGNYIHTVYVAESIAKGYFRYGDPSTGRWLPGNARRPAALPYWGHKRGIRADDGFYLPTAESAMPDAVTGPTPKSNFRLRTTLRDEAADVFYLVMEINQSWDWNRHWHNNRYPGDEHYMTSSQPAIVYKVKIDLNNLQDYYKMLPVGHSHWSGKTGELFTDLSTITTALDITKQIRVKAVH